MYNVENGDVSGIYLYCQPRFDIYIYMYHAEISHVSHCYCPCRCNGFYQHKSVFLHKMTFNKLQRLDCTT